MPRTECVIWALRHAREAAESVFLAVVLKCFAPACQDFMGICLVSYVEDYLVVGGVEDIVQAHDQLHRSQA